MSATGRLKRYRVKGIRAGEGVVSLGCNAASLEEARSQAAAQGVDAVTVRELLSPFSLPSRGSARFDLLRFSEQLHALLVAGLSIIEALSALSRKEALSCKRTVIDSLMRQLRQGKALSQAMRTHADEFPPLFLALVSASERSGALATALSRYIAYRVRIDSLCARIAAALLYPGLLLGVGGAVVLFLMFYVVPRFSRIYADFGHDLPFTSRLLMDWGALVTAHGEALLAGVAASIIILGLLRPQRPLQTVISLACRSRRLRERLRLFEVSRFYRTTGLLEQEGIPLVTAMAMGGALLGLELRPGLARAIEDVRAGTALSVSLDRQGLAPAVALDLIKVGEKSGELGEKLIRIADFYDEEQSRWLEAFAKLFEPVLMLVIGLFIASIVVLLYLPIFDLAGTLQ